ncbi:MAG: PPC domain-containing protein [Mycobacteriales bacterium]|nr:hypothetical protein [Frankia sp.]
MRAAVAAISGVLILGVGVSPAVAKKKPKPKPISGSYQAMALPDPGNEVSGTLCRGVSPTAWGEHLHDFKAPAAGVLDVTLTGYSGDWDLAIRDPDGDNAGESGSGQYPPVMGRDEQAVVKIKRAATYTIVACNWAGSPTATVKYTFTFS